jgi:hypothetical protein
MKRSVSFCVAIAAAIAGTVPTYADFSDGRLPDGTYRCEVYLLGLFLGLGDITIKGSAYSGPSMFGMPMQAYNYQMDENGEISWLGPLGGFTSGGNSISLTQATLDPGKPAAFDIIMLRVDGKSTAATCTGQD